LLIEVSIYSRKERFMNKILGYSKKQMIENKSMNTLSEIYRQSRVWKSIYERIITRTAEIENFINRFDKDTRIIFTGAGSSGFIGDSLAPIIRKEFGFNRVDSIHSTDIAACPDKYLIKDLKTVLISFGRSGDSPESIGAINIANKLVEDLYHIIITCNPQGKLSSFRNDKTLNLVFEEIEDQGFAMTSSVTGMMLAAYSIFAINRDLTKTIEKLAFYASDLITNKYGVISDLFNANINRLVVLGAGSLYGAAKESALKSIELTAGRITSWYDTPMGFRHGPKSMLNENTVILYFVSSSEYTRKYDIDMLKELSQSIRYKLAAVSDKYYEEVRRYSDAYLYNSSDTMLGEEFDPYICILSAQIFAIFASMSSGLTPDNPFPNGEVNRVVKGVTIYNL
jgi:tagatose-6-phosphate ketose/aldose isomerase